MIHPIAQAASCAPRQTLLVADGREWTAAELEDAVQGRASGLRNAGVEAGDVIGLLGPPSADWLISLHAIGWVGGVAAPLPHPSLPEAWRDLAEMKAILTSDPAAVTHPQALPMTLDGRVSQGPWTPTPKAPCLRMITSGTTGTPKAVDLTWGQIEASASASRAALGHEVRDAWLGCLPLHHIGGLSVFLRTARYQTTGVLHPSFDAGAVAQALDSGAVSQVSLVPTMLRCVLDVRPAAPFHPRVRLVLIGGAPMPPRLLERCRAIGLPVSLTWGMTETASQVATRTPGDLRSEPDSGPPLPGLEVHTEDGYLVVTGPTAPGGRLVTSDRGRLDAQGRVIVHGRGDDLILSGGENIDPREIERALESHPAVSEAAVVGRPDPRWGQRPVAFLVAAESNRPSPEALRDHLSSRIAGFKHPDATIWMEQLPRGPLGKIRRSDLIDQTESGEPIQED